MKDEATIRRLLAGDAAAVDEARGWIRGAFTPYRKRLAADLEDLEQETLIQLLDNLRSERFRGDSSLATYARKVAHFKCIDRLRSLTRREWIDISDVELEDEGPSALDAMSKAETVELARRILAEMPEGCREMWAMIQEGMRYDEMSQRLGVAEGTLRVRVLRCRKQALKMREKLGQEG